MGEYERRARPSLLGGEWATKANSMHPAGQAIDALTGMSEAIVSGDIQLSPINYVIDALTAIRDREEAEPGCTAPVEDLKEARDLISEAITALETAPAANTTFDPRPGQ